MKKLHHKKPVASSRQKQRIKKSVTSDVDTRLSAMREFLLNEWGAEAQTAEVIVRLVQHYGLHHNPSPQPGTTTREIQQKAKDAEAKARRQTFHDQVGKVGKVTPEKLAKKVTNAKRLARLKAEAEAYQTTRGDRIVSRFPTPEDRAKPLTGRRPDREITAFLQVAGRYLHEEHEVTTRDSQLSLLAEILCRAEGTFGPSPKELAKMKDRVRDRLRNAPPLDDWDYKIAIRDVPGEESKENLARQQEFMELINKAGDPNSGEEERAKANAELEQFRWWRAQGFALIKPPKDQHKRTRKGGSQKPG